MPDGLGDVRHGVAAVGPGGEEADLGLALGPDGPVEEADAGVAAARIGQDARGGCRREGPVPMPSRFAAAFTSSAVRPRAAPASAGV